MKKEMLLMIGVGILLNFLVTLSCKDLSVDAVKPDNAGVLTGTISIGPLCPVEKIPPAPECLPTAETYKAWQLAVWTKDKKSLITDIHPALDGTYQLRLTAGQYVIDYETSVNTRVGGSNLPVPIIISKGDTLKIGIDIDTGIR